MATASIPGSKNSTMPYRIRSFAIPAESAEAMSELAAAEGVSVSALIRGAAVAAYGDRDPRIAAMAQAAGTATVLQHMIEQHP
jgi:hypothetical protein